jgi:vitamin B12 transporter
VNQDRQNDEGVEMEYAYVLNKKISLKLQYSFITGQLSTTNGKADSSFFNLYRRPKSSFGIQVEDQINKHVYFSSSLQLTGKRTDIVYDANFQPVPVQLKAYVLWNMYGEYGIGKGRLKCFADLHNISNTQYTEVMGFNTMGFNATAGLRFSL